jgi:cystathionine beta-lyase/cystathionine gamma-synthase
MRTAWPKALKPGHLVRFSVGLESPAALIGDLAQALKKAFN